MRAQPTIVRLDSRSQRRPHRHKTAQRTRSTLDRIRTYDLRFRKPLLYPLSYQG